MKKTSLIFADFAKKIAENELKRDANTTTCGAVYQPPVPASLKKFSKTENDK